METSYPQNFSAEDQAHLVEIRSSSDFFAKVIFCFGLAVLASAGGAYTGFHYLGTLFITNPMLMWVFFAAELILVVTSRAWSQSHPLNYGLFLLFAFITGVTIAPLLAGIILQFGGPAIIVKAFMATTLAFTASAVFAWTTHRSLAGLGGFLWMGLIGMIIVSVIGIFIPWSNNFEIFFSGLGVTIFSGYVMYDVQRLKSYPTDRFIDAALQLYLDIFNLFLYILRLIAGLSRR